MSMVVGHCPTFLVYLLKLVSGYCSTCCWYSGISRCSIIDEEGKGGRPLYHSSLHMVAGARTASPLHSSLSGYQHVLRTGNGMTEHVGYVCHVGYTVTPVRINLECIWIEGLGSISGMELLRGIYNYQGHLMLTEITLPALSLWHG